jgi:hypothetical protein
MFTVEVALDFVWPMVLVTEMVLPDVGLTETETLTLDSSLSPWLVNLTVSVGLFDHGADARGVESVAVQARRRLAGGTGGAAAGAAAQVRGDGGRRQPRDVGHEAARGDLLAVDVVLVECVLDERRHALGVDHVGGEEGLHLARDAVDRLLGGLPAPERGGDLVGDLGQALGAQVEHELEVALGRAHVAGDVEPLGALDVVLGGQAQLVDLDLQALRVARAVGHALEERLAHRLVGVVDDRRDVAVVVLQRVGLAAVQAALEAEDDDDGEDRERAEADRLA